MDIALLRSSFELIMDRAPDLTVRFYDILFARYPQTRSMFGQSGKKRGHQEKMLAAALAAVLDHLDDPPWLRTTLENLGAKHVGYGVTDEMYGWVGESLLATLRDVAGDDWTPAMAHSWIAAFTTIASMMKDGARKALSSAA